MKNRLLWVLLGLALLLPCNVTSWAQDEIFDEYPELGVMRPDLETRLEWFQAYEEAPEAYIDESLSIPLKGYLNILGNLTYIPSERNQGSCGNCWAWAGTGVMEIELNRQDSIRDRLSLQYINSCESSYIGKTCCAGGWLYHVADFYTYTDRAIPWNNPGATWQDGDASCDTTCASVDTTPYYPISSINETVITTQGVSQATAIANIKNVLAQGKGVWWGFFMPTSSDGNQFKSFWHNQDETAVWNPDFTCGHTWSYGWGHAVLIVGYNDNDPANSYWIVLNSWGTPSSGLRPNGLFRLDMDMDYSCTHYDGAWYWSNYFQTLNMDYDSPTAFNSNACCNTGDQGCIDEYIETEVCDADPYCCNSYWDSLCVDEVTSEYGDTCECCTYHSMSEGCYDHDAGTSYEEAVSDCVCGMDSYCCNYVWDSICANEAKDYCGGNCEDCPPPVEPSNPAPADSATDVGPYVTLSWSTLMKSGAAAESRASVRALEASSGTGNVADIGTGLNAPQNSLSSAGGDKNGLPDLGLAVDCTCDDKYETGTPVVALVDNPSGKSDVYAGDTGTVVCGSTTYPGWVLVSWDGIDTGHDGNGYCTCPVASVPDMSGWWVLCDEVALNQDPCPITYDVYLGTTSPDTLVASDLSSPSFYLGLLDYNTTYYWQVVAKTPGGSTAGPVWSFNTTHPCCNTGGPGCVDNTVEAAVCAADSYCCNTSWDSICVSEVTSVYGDTCECCLSHSKSEGCYDTSSSYPEAVSDCVCDMDSYCGYGTWDSICANEAKDYCGGNCEDCPPPVEPSNPGPADGATDVDPNVNLVWGNIVMTGAAAESRASVRALEASSGTGNVADIGTGLNAPQNSLSSEGGEKDGLPDLGLAVDCTCDGKYVTGTPVVALVDNPSGKSDVYAGDTGTVVCGSTTYPGWVLVSWDGIDTGHNGNGYCTCPVASVPDLSGWWVYCDEIAMNQGPCPITYDVYLGTTSPSTLICSDLSSPLCDPGTLAGDTTYYWQVVAKTPGGSTAGAVWSFDTAPLQSSCACDLDVDFDCDGSDWYLFSNDWGNDCSVVDCACDIDNDNDCDGSDWYLFSNDWGEACYPVTGRCKGQVCGEYTFDCDPSDPYCACYTTAEGVGSCSGNYSCSGLQECESSGECPGGYACMVQTCCGVGVCIPDNECLEPAAVLEQMSVSEGMTTTGR